MNKVDYDRYMQLVDEFEECLINCAQEISLISNGRELIGEFDGDIDSWDNGRYYVRFETRSCGESNGDVVYVPSEYIYNKEYRKYYEKVLIQEKERKVAAALEREKQRKKHTYRVIVDERTEYERLKKKFGE